MNHDERDPSVLPSRRPTTGLHQTVSMARPVVKWAGGKRRLLPELLACVPQSFRRYYEPFAGGAALFFALSPDRAVLGDLNADLITMYRGLADDPEAVIRGLRDHERRHSSRYFYAMRVAWNARRRRWSGARRAATFLYLNRTCFNGLWRVNRSGEFNVPLGHYRAPVICQPELLRCAHNALRRADLRTGDYRDTIHDAQLDDVVYLDPPYLADAGMSSFTSYAAPAFGEDDHRELARIARDLVQRGCHVIVSNSCVRAVRSLYRGFRAIQVRCARSINSAVHKRGAVDELLLLGVRTTSVGRP